jgi:hypothetical protein
MHAYMCIHACMQPSDYTEGTCVPFYVELRRNSRMRKCGDRISDAYVKKLNGPLGGERTLNENHYCFTHLYGIPVPSNKTVQDLEDVSIIPPGPSQVSPDTTQSDQSEGRVSFVATRQHENDIDRLKDEK